MRLAKKGDIIFEPAKLAGPTALGRGSLDQETKIKSCRILARYTTKNGPVQVKLKAFRGNYKETYTVEGITTDEVKVSTTARNRAKNATN